ncbi:MAG: 2-C-methyl-D-erythritol 4-phosphate cytidylyltransferase [Nitrospina sp.]|jgi:2-C-methyl-D-erythritol 4-phosphate cytidylyltransferase|nr:2-C-methyl-D-erythritol 4-phosphate cytidylyltransferase [Nitrospina sp.]MBT5986294.1 2-C-methyl-D-erythritol 4-phosphate cytidylyltransferase [Nitrospina sp.]
MKVGAIIPAAGRGKRIGASIPKQFLEIQGRPLLHHTLTVFASCKLIDYVVLVMPRADVNEVGKDWMNKYKIVQEVVVGGEQRQDSVYNGFNSLEKGTDIVVVHDGVRPFTTPQMITATVEAAQQYGAAITAIPVSDTVKQAADGFVKQTVSRDGLWRVQTPQAFQHGLLQQAFKKAKKDSYYGTDEGSLVEYLGERVKIVPGSELNIKITRKEDLVLGESLLSRIR